MPSRTAPLHPQSATKSASCPSVKTRHRRHPLPPDAGNAHFGADDVSGSEPKPTRETRATSSATAEEEEAEAEEEPKQETAPAAVVPPRQVEAQADDAAVYDLDTLTVLIMDGVPRIRLDATLEDRRLFTELRNALKSAGYRFDGKTQSWYFPEAA